MTLPGILQRVSFGWLTAAVFLIAPAHAWAQEDDEVQACINAYEQAQVARNEGKLVDAQEHLRLCIQESCPEFVRTDCGQWLSDVKRDVPSVIFSAVDSSGKDVTDVRISIDEKEVATSIDGRPIELNPGAHKITYEYKDKTQTESVVIRQGEKNRVIKVELAVSEPPSDRDGDGVPDAKDQCPDEHGEAARGGCPAPPPAVETPLSEDDEALRIGAYIGWGVGGAGLATMAIFYALGKSAESAALDECKTPEGEPPRCTREHRQELVDDVDQKLLIGNIGLGIGIAGAVTGTVLYFLSTPDDSSESARKPARSPLKVDMGTLREGGGFIQLGTTF